MKKKQAVEPERILIPGRPNLECCDNKIISAKYTIWSFFPKAILAQFRRLANLYFLIIGCIMAVGWYSEAYDSAISPWTTFGPLSVVIAISLLVEGSADFKRHRNDDATNSACCVVLDRAETLENDDERDDHVLKGKDVTVNLNKAFYAEQNTVPGIVRTNSNNSTMSAMTAAATAKRSNEVRVAFKKVRRMDIRQGHFVLIKNRDMVPADVVLLASANDHGSAYIETSSIDGETNLKLRTSPRLPDSMLQYLKEGNTSSNPLEKINEFEDEEMESLPESNELHNFESIAQATKRLTRFSALGRPNGDSALDHHNYVAPADDDDDDDADEQNGQEEEGDAARRISAKAIKERVKAQIRDGINANKTSSFKFDKEEDGKFVSALTTEAPNPSVHTFNGRLTFPPFETNGAPLDVPLGAENILLRGAVLRNTEWAIGVACFTGDDTKLIQNSFETPSKFSALDQVMNETVLAILCFMLACITCLAALAEITNNREFDNLWYAGLNQNQSEPWPYLPDLPPPKWKTQPQSFIQFFFLYVTLLNNFIPLSLYVTVEFVTFCMLWFLYSDLDMYDDTTNTRATARSTTVTDLGRVQYIFSDKTGTLTQNVMRFKRCSVDGMAFGAPIQKATPGNDEDEVSTPFLPLRQLLVGRMKHTQMNGLESLGIESETDRTVDGSLTFNAEMFMRVLCLCHTVVVEKDLDKKDHISSGLSQVSNTSATRISIGTVARSLFGRKRTNTGDSDILSGLDMDEMETASRHSGNRSRSVSVNSLPEGKTADDFLNEKSADGAPYGYAYQAESPDEGALVSAASSTYGFQVVQRDSAGIRLRVAAPSLLQNPKISDGIRSGTLSLKRIAAESGSIDLESAKVTGSTIELDSALRCEAREETWSILAVNKFDSDRKRMSILLRSPPELGSLPILFCKGADSAMLDPDVASSSAMLTPGKRTLGSAKKSSMSMPTSISGRSRQLSAGSIDESFDESTDDFNPESWDMATLLGTQAHLGDFAREGLRTLVLGLRVLSEDECNDWLVEYKAAAVATKNRSKLLTDAAYRIERNLHIVGATAIEDKLQKNVPQTIDTLARAGIKLWVLTGDKRETAVEIGYSTMVLTPKMHLTQMPDNGKQHVRTQLCMEFLRLVKHGKLPEYQRAQLDSQAVSTKHRWENFWFSLGVCYRWFKSFLSRLMLGLSVLMCMKKRAKRRRDAIQAQTESDSRNVRKLERSRKIRARVDATIQTWLNSEEAKAQRPDRTSSSEEKCGDDVSLASEESPAVFSRASTARELLSSLRTSGHLVDSELRELSLAQLTLQQSGGGPEEPIVDEDTLSLKSYFPEQSTDLMGSFDAKKRTTLERLFAIDKQVRKGQLKKHLHWQVRDRIEERAAGGEVSSSMPNDTSDSPNVLNGSRALVIEGAALKHLLGNSEMEEILFAVASQCDTVIACRVSPQQKALLVKLVRQNVTPEPITLAIGDGANDVGMIQEAHVGVGISGKEGQQAVNASDFAIAQFSFLETLILIHGRWNFFRLTTVTLFSFYKNSVMACILIIYTPRSLYSGTPLFDEWVIAMLNFVAAWPIVTVGLFDRCLGKEYVRKNPEVFRANRENELITSRTLIRWIALVCIHAVMLYFFIVPQTSFGGGMNSSHEGLMKNREDDFRPGDGEGGDLKSVGVLTFSCMIILFAYKVLLEARSLVHGRWPAVSCHSDEGVVSRMAHTWIGVIFLSILFYTFGICIYQLIGRDGAGPFSRFVDTPNHVFGTRSLSWMLLGLVPVAGITFDLAMKVFSNLFYPTQTQIHMEIEAKGKRTARLQRIERTGTRRRPPVEVTDVVCSGVLRV